MASLYRDKGEGEGGGRGRLKARYDELAVDREPYLDRARDCSSLTLPYLIPPDDTPNGQKLPSLFQSVGANGVTNLASKLLLTMLPPNEPCFRLRMNDVELEKEQEEMDKDFAAKIDRALSRFEQAVLADIEARGDRPTVHEGNQHLIVGGNVLYHDDPDSGLRMFPLSRYVVDRDSMGNVREIIVEEHIAFEALPENVQEILIEEEDKYKTNNKDEDDGSERYPKEFGKSDKFDRKKDNEVALYTGIKRGKKNWTVIQECCGKIVPGSKGTYKLDACPWFPVRMYSIAGENYGRSFVEQQIGDLSSLESLNQALVEASTISSKTIILVNPNSVTSARAIAEAQNGAVLEGAAEDISVMQIGKGADLQVTAAKIQALEQSLKTAFLMMNGIQRNAERVTAEEIRLIAQELETGLGGVYTVISTEFQLPYIRSRINIMQRQRRLPRLPEGIVEPSIVTGFEALGRGNDKQKLLEFLQFGAQTFGEAFLGLVNPQNAVMRLAASMGIPTEGLIKSEDQVMQEQQQAEQMQHQMQMQGMIEKLGPSAIKEIGGMAQAQQTQTDANQGEI